MYTGKHARLRPLQPAFIMANSGESVTYAELQARTNRLAHLFRTRGLKRMDHYAIFMENNSRYLETCGAGERAGLYYTCVNSYLTAGELAYIVNNSRSRILITSVAKLDIVREALQQCPKVELCIVADGSSEGDRIVGLRDATSGLPKTPIQDECIGTAMLYSSGTTGRPKGILRPLPEQPPIQQLPIFDFLQKLWQYREGMIYLSPARHCTSARRSSSASSPTARVKAIASSACAMRPADCPKPRSRMSASEPRCFTRRERRGGQRESCARWPSNSRRSNCLSSISCKSFGSIAKA